MTQYDILRKELVYTKYIVRDGYHPHICLPARNHPQDGAIETD
jgi:hypothetical protein